MKNYTTKIGYKMMTDDLENLTRKGNLGKRGPQKKKFPKKPKTQNKNVTISCSFFSDHDIITNPFEAYGSFRHLCAGTGGGGGGACCAV